jgi:hypothetical protein
LRGFLGPPIIAFGKGERFDLIWHAGGPWREKRGKQKDGKAFGIVGIIR